MFHKVDCKLGNMRKVQEWVIYPANPDDTHAVIQCDQRIARVELATGATVLSSGKGGHPGLAMLSKVMGATVTTCPPDALTVIRAAVATMTGKLVCVVG